MYDCLDDTLVQELLTDGQKESDGDSNCDSETHSILCSYWSLQKAKCREGISAEQRVRDGQDSHESSAPGSGSWCET